MRRSLRGWLAQLVEHRPYKARVTGSIPVPPTKRKCFHGPVVQLVRMPACHAGGRGFESRPVRHLFWNIFASYSFAASALIKPADQKSLRDHKSRQLTGYEFHNIATLKIYLQFY